MPFASCNHVFEAVRRHRGSATHVNALMAVHRWSGPPRTVTMAGLQRITIMW